MAPSPFSRRDFLKTAATLAGAAALPSAALGSLVAAPGAAAPKYKTQRVIVVAFAGGVRTRDTFGTPANAPNLARIAKSGVLFPNTHSSNLGHFGAALSIFTGTADFQGIRENDRGDYPTVFEYLRKQLALSANDVWLSATGGVQQQNYTHSYHRSYGEPYGANLISSDGIFNAEFQQVLGSFGKVRAASEPEAEILAKLRGALSEEFRGRNGAASELNPPEALRSIEKFILDELNQGTSRITGPGAGRREDDARRGQPLPRLQAEGARGRSSRTTTSRTPPTTPTSRWSGATTRSSAASGTGSRPTPRSVHDVAVHPPRVRPEQGPERTERPRPRRRQPRHQRDLARRGRPRLQEGPDRQEGRPRARRVPDRLRAPRREPEMAKGKTLRDAFAG